MAVSRKEWLNDNHDQHDSGLSAVSRIVQKEALLFRPKRQRTREREDTRYGPTSVCKGRARQHHVICDTSCAPDPPWFDPPSPGADKGSPGGGGEFPRTSTTTRTWQSRRKCRGMTQCLFTFNDVMLPLHCVNNK